MNATAHGISAKRVLMPGETLEEHRHQLDAWTTTLGPRTAGEAILVAKISDAFLRLDRIDRQARRVADEGVDVALKQAESGRRLSVVTDALQAVGALAETVETVAGSVELEVILALGPAMRRTVEMVEAVDVPMSLLVPLRDAVNAVLTDAVIGVEPETFHDLGVVARDVETYLTVARAAARAAIEEERIQLAQDPSVGDPAQLGRLDIYRRRTTREIEDSLNLLRDVRALAADGTTEPGSFVGVELRVIEGRILPGC